MSYLPATISELQQLTSYSRLPSSLEKTYPEIAGLQKADVKGCVDRLNAIECVLEGRNLGEAIDLGGNSGYFCLSLIDWGMVSRASVYDRSARALAVGQAMAKGMGIDTKIEYLEQAIDMEFLRSLPKVDTILCLNLLHHAGKNFDAARVEREGWGNYIGEWLFEMRRKCQTAIISVGFKEKKPRYWDAPYPHRPARFAELAEQAGWSVVYDANVSDIQRLGVEAADGHYTKGGRSMRPKRKRTAVSRKVKSVLERSGLRAMLKPRKPRSRSGEYHFYILRHEPGIEARR